MTLLWHQMMKQKTFSCCLRVSGKLTRCPKHLPSPFSDAETRMCDVITHTHTAPHHMMHNEVPYHSFDTLCLSLPFSV